MGSEGSDTALLSLLRRSSFWLWSLTAQLARSPVLMAALAFTGLTASTVDSAKTGGVLVSSFMLSQVVFAGPVGRLLDRGGGAGAGAAAAFAAVGAAMLVVLGLAGAAGAGLPLLAVLCALSGALLAGLPGAVRHRLSSAVPSGLLERALSIDATMVEMTVAAAPLVVAAALLLGPSAGVHAMAVAAAASAVLLFLNRADIGNPQESTPAGGPGGTGLWTLPTIAWFTVSFAFGQALGTIETAALALAQQLRAGPLGAGGIIATLAVSGAAAGLAYAGLARRLKGGSAARAAPLLVVVAVMIVVASLATDWIVLLGAVVLVGVATAPLNAIRSFALESLLPAGRRQEGFSWLYTFNGLGFAVGGVLLAAFPVRVALALPMLSALAALVLLLAQRGASRAAAPHP
ncbi:hypothetical protein [Nonomuraea sp. NPDC050643]|uniref:hypothetical protein n=1 Tax=Nonomuraea sp. NPDC050643 TaxID=3155660 RepID=UPI0033FDE9EB